MPKPLTVWTTTNCGKFWTRWAYQTTLLPSWEICMQVKKQQVRWSGISISLRIFHSLLWPTQSKALAGIVSKAEVDVFLKFSCFFDDPADVGHLISGSSAFSKTSLNIWKLMVHILLKPGLENFEHYFASMWDECNCAVVWTFFGTAFLGIRTWVSAGEGCYSAYFLQEGIPWHMLFWVLSLTAGRLILYEAAEGHVQL